MIKVITPPAAEPITLEEAKLHLRVVETDEDPLIERLIAAARGMLEQRTNRRLMLQTIEFAVPCFGAGIFLPAAPFASVDSVGYTDPDGAAQTWPESSYFVYDYVEPAAITVAWGSTWPQTRAGSLVVVRAQVGYATAADVPAELKMWMLLAITALYDNRAAVVAGVSVTELPPDFMSLLWHPYMVYL